LAGPPTGWEPEATARLRRVMLVPTLSIYLNSIWLNNKYKTLLFASARLVRVAEK
jgi:hypothetical protein